jgi:hypothetical protein
MTSQENNTDKQSTDTESSQAANSRQQHQPHGDDCSAELSELILRGKSAASEVLRRYRDGQLARAASVICINAEGVKQWDAIEIARDDDDELVEIAAGLLLESVRELIEETQAHACVLITARSQDDGDVIPDRAQAGDAISVIAVDNSGASFEARAVIDPADPNGHSGCWEHRAADADLTHTLAQALQDQVGPEDPLAPVEERRPVVAGPNLRFLGASEQRHVCVSAHVMVVREAIERKLSGLAPGGVITPYLTFAGEEGCWAADLEFPEHAAEREEYCRLIACELCARRARAAALVVTAEGAAGEELIYILSTDDEGCEEHWQAAIIRSETGPPEVEDWRWVEAMAGTYMFMLHLGVKNVEAMVGLAERDGIPTAFKLPA